MRNFILSATVLVFAGLSASQAETINNSFTSSLQDTTKKDTVQTPQDTSKKEASLAYAYTVEQDSTTQAPAVETAPVATAEERAEIKLADLPEAVKTTLTADIFKEWVPSTSYHVKAEGKEYYHIEVKKGEDLRSIKIGADGKVTE